MNKLFTHVNMLGPAHIFFRNIRCIHGGMSTAGDVGPLKGIRVLDLTRILAGPYCTMLLGDLGAEVIKIERPGVGDDTRRWGPPFHYDESCYFLSVNRNKKSLVVDLKDPKGKDIIKQLAKNSDILIENYVPGKLDELGLGYETLKEDAPGLIYCSITGYGSDGPYAQRTGYDVVAAAMGGLLHITGPEDGEPCRVGVAMTDLATGLVAKGAVLAALHQRHLTGIGQKIDCNLLSSQVAILTHIAANYLIAGQEAKRYGTGHPSIVPYQAFQTQDGGYIIIGAGNDGFFNTLCEKLELSHLAKDERFTSNEKRVNNRNILIPLLAKRFLDKTLQEWLDVLEGCGLPYGPVNSLEQVFQDPQVLHNQMILDLNHPTCGPIKVAGPAVKYSGETRTDHLPPPRLGEHTSDVLQSVLNYNKETIASLKSSGVIGVL